jgi:hypothetical protein
MSKSLRNRSKAYNMNDSLKDEYSINLNGKKYPLMSAKFKGFTNKNTKNGKTRFNKIFYGDKKTKREYINTVSSLLNLGEIAKEDVGDVGKNKFDAVKDGSNIAKQAPLKLKANVQVAPESVEAFKQEAEEQKEMKTKDPNQQPVDIFENPKQPSQEAMNMIQSGMKKMSRGGKLKGKKHSEGGINMKVYKKGGYLNGEPIDEVEVEDGEYVMNAESTQQFEKELNEMNDAGNKLRDAKNTNDRSQRMKRIQQLKARMRRGGQLRKMEKGGALIERLPDTDSGLMGRLQMSDGKKDKGMYMNEISKYFSKLDFTRTVAYIKAKNKQVEKMSPQEMMSMAQDIAKDLKINVKYQGNDKTQLKNQLYELMAIRLASQKQQEPKQQEQATEQEKKNIGFVVDVESIYGDGSEIDKEKFAKKYYSGGKLNMDNIRNDMRNQNLDEVITGGQPKLESSGLFTQPKPEQQKAFKEMKNLSSGEPQEEGAVSGIETSYDRKTFNLSDALINVEDNWRHRYAKKIDEPNEQFKKQSIFRIKKMADVKVRRNLL